MTKLKVSPEEVAARVAALKAVIPCMQRDLTVLHQRVQDSSYQAYYKKYYANYWLKETQQLIEVAELRLQKAQARLAQLEGGHISAEALYGDVDLTVGRVRNGR